MNNNTSKLESQALMREVIQRVAVGPDRGRDINVTQATSVLDGILNGDIDEVQVAVFLIALRMKRESIEEFSGLLDSLLEHTQTREINLPNLWCLADPFDGYVRHVTMTPFLPAVLASCGLPSLMHGVKSVGPKHGVTAAKVYELLNLNTRLTSDETAQRLINCGWCYIDQSEYNQPLFALQDLRDRIIKRSALTTLERVLMPISANRTHLVLGYVHKAYPEIYASMALRANYDSVLLLKGVEGGLAPALNKPIRRFFFEQDLPIDINEHKEIIEIAICQSHTAAAQLNQEKTCIDSLTERTAQIGLSVLNGESKHIEMARDSLIIAAANVMHAYAICDSLYQAVEKVQTSLDNGSAFDCFNQ